MAIAGNTDEAFHLQIVNGRLNNLGKHRVTGSIIETDLAKAIAILLAGKPVYLHARGDNLAQVKNQVNASGIEV